MVQLTIDETGRNSLKENCQRFNTITENFPSVEEAKSYLIDRYGKLPKGKNKIYIDTETGKPKIVGFLHSFWNQDISHNSKKWYQTDWVSLSNVTSEPILI